MINCVDHPTAWAFFMRDLRDAHEHLGNLIRELESDSAYDEPELRIDLGHVYAHLNRAWQRRDMTRDFSDEEWIRAGAFPDDLEPMA